MPQELESRYREAFADRENVFRAAALFFVFRRARKALGSAPNSVIISTARARGIPSLSAVSFRDSGLKSSFTGRRMFNLFLIHDHFTTLIRNSLSLMPYPGVA